MLVAEPARGHRAQREFLISFTGVGPTGAQWGAGRVVRYAPDGSISGTIDLPTTQVTCIAFGGTNLDLLFVTSARQGMTLTTLAQQPHAGDLFVYQLDVKGLPEPRFAGAPGRLVPGTRV